MSKLDKITAVLTSKVNAGEMTLESASAVLEKAKAKYSSDDKTVTESTNDNTDETSITLEEAIDGINQLLDEAESCGNCGSAEKTSKDAPKLPEDTKTGEQVTNAIEANNKKSEAEMEKLAKNNDANATADADGEKDKDTTKEADPVHESVNALRLRVYEAARAGQITDDEKETFLEYLNLDNYKTEEEDSSVDRKTILEAFKDGVLTEEEAIEMLK